jgi:hypothetical protein
LSILLSFDTATIRNTHFITPLIKTESLLLIHTYPFL